MFGLSMSLFVQQLVHHFLACLCVQGTFKVLLYTEEILCRLGVCKWSTMDRNGLVARKVLVLTNVERSL